MDMKLDWHLRYNIFPPITAPKAIEGISLAIQRTAEGKGDGIAVGNLTHIDIVEDLKLWDFVESNTSGLR